MNEFVARTRVLAERVCGPARDRFIGLVDVNDALRFHVQHPENLLDIPGHLLKARLAPAKGFLDFFPPGNIPQDGDMPARQIVCFGRIFDGDGGTILAQEFRFSVLRLSLEKRGPRRGGMPLPQMKKLDRLADEFVVAGGEENLGCWIYVETDSAVIEDHDAIERIVKNGLELAFGSIQGCFGLAVLAPRQNQKASMQGNRDGERGQDQDQQRGRDNAVKSRSEKYHRRAHDDDGAKPRPAARTVFWIG